MPDLYLYGEIGEWGINAQEFVDELNALGAVDQITVNVNSGGGNLFDGLAIYNALRSNAAEITVYVDGLAASIASVIAMAASPGQLFMRESALMMIHNPATFAAGESDDMRKAADALDKSKATIVKAYMQRSSMAEDEINALMDDTTWLTSEEAVEFGFADAIAESLPAAASIDLSNFDKAPVTALAVPAMPKADEPENSASPAPTQSEPTDDPQQPEEAKMPTVEQDVSAGTDAKTPTTDQVNSILAAEKQRRTDIRALFSTGGWDNAHRSTLDACLDDPTVTVENAQAQLLNRLGQGAESIATDAVDIEPGETSHEKFLNGAEIAICARLGLEKIDRGNEFRGISLSEVARRCLNHAGVRIPGRSKDAVASAIFNAHSTSDFPALLANTANKQLRTAYEEEDHNWRSICDVGSVPDFKQNSRIQLGSFSSLEEIKEGGEYTYGDIDEDSATIQAVVKGKGLRLTRQTLVNDDLNGFGRRAAFMGRAAARTVAKDVFALINAGAMFSAPNGNLAGSGSAPSYSSVSAGRAAMRKQQSGEDYLNIRPAVFLVPPELEDVALQLMQSTGSPDDNKSSGVVNTVRNLAEVVVDPYLSDTALGGTATAWYLIASPALVPLLEVAFLDGNETPFVDEMVNFNTDSMDYKVRLDYGVAEIDYRGGYKDPGA